MVEGTQGGTFTPQRENPFSRAIRAQQRRDSNVSDASDDSFRSLLTSSDNRNSNIGESSGTTAFLVSDSHSINGEFIYNYIILYFIIIDILSV